MNKIDNTFIALNKQFMKIILIKMQFIFKKKTIGIAKYAGDGNKLTFLDKMSLLNLLEQLILISKFYHLCFENHIIR